MIPSKTIIVKPPAGTKDPLRYLSRKVDPNRENINFKHAANISNNREIIRVNTESTLVKITENPALVGCEFLV